MKWLVTFLLGILIGAVGLGMYLHETRPTMVSPQPPASTPSPPVVVGPPVTPAKVEPPRTPSVDIAPLPTAPASREASLLIPVAGISAAQLVNTFDQPRGTERRHEALDILAPRGTEVRAVADGKLVKLFDSKPGGLTVYQFDQSEQYAYYYAHLDRYASGVTEGMVLRRGDLLGYVGSTGNADPAAPHLHFAIFELFPEKQWWKGTPLNPYALLGGVNRP